MGKVLRLNLDGSIPKDNPSFNGVVSHIYTLGHRNPQGLAFAPNGKLLQSEQGPNSDDEINLVLKGGNYGWPNVAGYKMTVVMPMQTIRQQPINHKLKI